ncbi:MAG: hypothetical protein QOJ95_1182, partial [Mycobacterium sp.]|nr:hypothetical protein [Mycobacterium sp.]
MLGTVAVGAALALTFGSSATAAADTRDGCNRVSSENDTVKKTDAATSAPSRATSTGANDGTGPLGTSPVKPVTKVATTPTVTGGRTSP